MAKRRASHHVELERKFDVPGADPHRSPSFDGLALVGRAERMPAQSLEAVYFDTAGHDLAVRRITLRRRTGGPDAGWHLKLPAAAGARTEVRSPLTGGTQDDGTRDDDVPAELRDLIAAVVRDRPLVPVARIATEREVTVLRDAEGAPLAEFCDDRVSASALDPADGSPGPEQRWREWELELGEAGLAGGPALLDRLGTRLRDAGATPAGHGSKLAKVLGDALPPGAAGAAAAPGDPVHRAVAEQIDRLLEWDRAVRTDTDDAVHQMRVTIRQIRSLLQASEEAFGLTDDAWVLTELRELAAVLGTARDAEVLADRYQTALDELPGDLVRGPVRDRLVEGARRRYQSGLRRSLNALRSQRYFRLLDALDALVIALPAEAGPANRNRAGGRKAALAAGYRRVSKATKKFRASRDAPAGDRDAAAHRIRKAAKRLRYVAAATGDNAVVQRCKTVQTLLGDHQDSVVSREHLLDRAAAAHAAGEDTFTYGVLYEQEAQLAQRCRDQLGDALRALRRSVDKALR